MDCERCNSSNVAVSTVDDREMYRCSGCRHQWYSHRKTTGPYLSVVDEIADAVANRGAYEIDVEILLNTIWPGESFDQEIERWCKSHDFAYRLVNRRSRKETNQVVQFFRRH